MTENQSTSATMEPAKGALKQRHKPLFYTGRRRGVSWPRPRSGARRVSVYSEGPAKTDLKSGYTVC